jgi:hypothetical protein
MIEVSERLSDGRLGVGGIDLLCARVDMAKCECYCGLPESMKTKPEGKKENKKTEKGRGGGISYIK